MNENSVSAAGQEITYRESAGTGRSVVLVHGNSSSARTWQALMAGPFGERFRCLALDLPGHGRSKPATHADVYSIPVSADGTTFDEAITEMITSLREYAEDWQDRLLDTPNHRDN
ncbi:alpha/beta fold hydrolase, partial [Kibdelosporangium lantanae]